MRRWVWALALAGAACGPPGPSPSEGVILRSKTSGQAGGVRFHAPLALADTFQGRTRVLLTDAPGACDSLDVAQSRPVVRDARGVVQPSLLLLVAPTRGADQRIGVDVTADLDPGGDAGPAACDPADGGADAGADAGCEARVLPATGGFVHLLEARDGGPEVLEGVFDSVYARGHLNGAFRAEACPRLHQTPQASLGCQSAGGAALLPLLALAGLRRRARR